MTNTTMKIKTPLRGILTLMLNLALLGVAKPAYAGLHYTYSATVDLSAQGVTLPFSYWNTGSAPTFDLQTGDTISGTISFANSQRLQLRDPTGTSVEGMEFVFGSRTIGGSDPALFHWQSSMTLLNVQGQHGFPGASLQSGGSGGSYAVSLAGEFADFVTTTQMSFSGFDYSAELTSDSGSFTPSYLRATSFSGEINVVSVPEPATAAFGMATVAVALLSRRRNASSAVRFCSPIE